MLRDAAVSVSVCVRNAMFILNLLTAHYRASCVYSCVCLCVWCEYDFNFCVLMCVSFVLVYVHVCDYYASTITENLWMLWNT
jgi:hypothetical protein